MCPLIYKGFLRLVRCGVIARTPTRLAMRVRAQTRPTLVRVREGKGAGRYFYPPHPTNQALLYLTMLLLAEFVHILLHVSCCLCPYAKSIEAILGSHVGFEGHTSSSMGSNQARYGLMSW
jgi:hypothetical protein